MQEKYHHLIQVLGESVKACENCYRECITDENKDCAASCRDVISVSKAAIEMAENKSQNLNLVTRICAEILRRCAEECEVTNISSCRKTAEVCLDAAGVCEGLRIDVRSEM